MASWCQVTPAGRLHSCLVAPSDLSSSTLPTDPCPTLRAALDAVPAYIPGKPASAPEGVTAYKLSSNENPFPPLDAVRVVLDKTLDVVNRYPDMASVDLVAAIAAFVGCDPANIAVGTGSVGILGQIVQATCDAGDEVVFAWRSFEAYPIVAALADARAVMVPVDAGQRHQLGLMADAVTERTRVIVCSPNNPRGRSCTATVGGVLVRGCRGRCSWCSTRPIWSSSATLTPPTRWPCGARTRT
jgi:histidinol-phosphate aminotransferase